MSRAAYESYFGTTAPDGAVFFADISYWQGREVWSSLASWADSVCIRTSYGRSGDDGRQAEHFQYAKDFGFTGTLGTYHYVIPNSGMSGNLSNYLSASAPYVDQTKYDMLDFEEGPVPSNQFVNDMCDGVEQTRQRPCFIYGGKSYLDQVGPIQCPAGKIWIAQYPGRSANPWKPTTDWNSWDAPLMPNQYGAVLPGVWQWSSTAQGFSLDLDISTTPEMLGIGGGTNDTGDDFLQYLDQQTQFDLVNRVNAMYAQYQTLLDKVGMLYAVMFDDGGRWGRLFTAASQIQHITDVIDKLSTSGMDVEALASELAVRLGPSAVDYAEVRKVVRTELGNLKLALGQ